MVWDRLHEKITRFGAVLTKLWPCGLRAGGVDGLVWFLFLPFEFSYFLVGVVVHTEPNKC